MTTITLPPWDGKEALETEATAADGRWLSLYAAALPACPWQRWLWTVDTPEDPGEHDLRPIAIGIAHSPEGATTAAETAAKHWLQPTPPLTIIT